jgi:hypothetical protein
MSTEENANKFFDKKNYHTIIVKADDIKEDEKEIGKNKKATIVDLLTNENNKDIKEDAYKLLKQGKGVDLLKAAISESKNHPKKHLLVAAFWEANIDCKDHLSFFVDLALNDSYEVCLEALTVIEEMQGPIDKNQTSESIGKIEKWLDKNQNENKKVLIDSMLSIIRTF